MVVITGLLLTGLCGCGKKAPPIAPARLPLPQVTELKGSLEDDTVTLVWRPAGQGGVLRSFDVLRAQSEADKPPCQGCPMIFQKVGTPAFSNDAERYIFSEAVAAGFVYTYKVQPVGSPGDQGPASNLVVIDRSSH